jgi:acyl-coenzyme A thioesterase 9
LISVNIYLGRFSMVCRDAAAHTARMVNPLIISAGEEQQLSEIGAGVYSIITTHP